MTAMASTTRRTFTALLAALAALALAAACGGGDEEPATAEEPLRIGLLLNFTDGAEVASAARQQGFELAIRHVNEGGGVLGRPVEWVLADPSFDADTAVATARRLVEEEGVHAIVGPSSSGNALPIAAQVAGPLGVPVISPSATSPALTTADDGDFFFRTALSDVAQGPVLARLARDRGFGNVGVAYRDDPWGRGLAETFAAAWDGEIASAPIDPDAATHLPALRATAANGAAALVVLTFGREAETVVREALDEGLYDQFLFGDAAKRVAIVEAIGGDRLGGMYGTAGVANAEGESREAWEAAWRASYGDLPVTPYVRAVYDAAVAIALAAQAAGSLDGAAIRDQLRAVGGPPGAAVHAGADGIAEALRLLRADDPVDYDGASAPLDWDARGDLVRGHIGIWRFTSSEGIEDVRAELWEQE